MSAEESFDVVVVGSGAAGAMAALRAAERGLSVLIVEKERKFGGTSAVSGGVMWVPNHGLDGEVGDSREAALEYLRAIISVPVNAARLEAYVDMAPAMLSFLTTVGVPVVSGVWPDYFPDRPGARSDRSLVVPTFDGRRLGDSVYPAMREQYNRFKLFGRYAMDLTETFTLMMQAKGWRRTVAHILRRYWLDRETRAVGRRDRRFTQGAALMGEIYEKVLARGVELRTETALVELQTDAQGRVCALEVDTYGRRYTIAARHGVVLAAGGFEWNQELRERFYPVPGRTRHSSTPEDANRGEALIAGEKIGASTEHTEQAGGFRPCSCRCPGPPTSTRSTRPPSMSGARIASASTARACASSTRRRATTASGRPWSPTTWRRARTARAGSSSMRPSAKNSAQAASCPTC
ncbi:hypothetical protein MBENS4_1252 [Novosphingobium sp. MBES04]|nr:hypothetical protein MBENS4_1252 [Novosphingobium sp. MBES04]